MKTIVILVDNKRRDLPGLALVAHHLKKIGVRCELEPLGAWRSVLWAHRPNMIIFNHLTAKHLERYSRTLAKQGILTAVLPNEGILYDKEVLEYNASRFHNSAHIDHFFCWNAAHANAIQTVMADQGVQVHIIGIPRFDFYFPPLATSQKPTLRKKILICTNFVFSKFADCDQSVAEHFFGRWSEAVTAYKKWPEFVKINRESKIRFFEFLKKAVNETPYDFILRPHPNENPSIYEGWFNDLDENTKKRIRYERNTPVPELLLECDLEIACDTCTTSLEAWIIGKPTIELHLTDHPVFHHEFVAELNSLCAVPGQLPALINELLEKGSPEQFSAPRKEHLRKWCNTPDGHVCERFAAILKGIVESQPEPDFSNLSFPDIRRGLRLKALKKIGLPCTYSPLLSIKYALNPKKYSRKNAGQEKTIKPSDVRAWEEKFKIMGL
jgi:surface carbohydrate biosynthesis protein